MTTPTTSAISLDERNDRLDGPVHGWFGLSYANYLVVPRALMQSMPVGWQERMVACLAELDAAFDHVEQAPAYKVQAAREVEYGELTEAEMARLDVTRPGAFDDEGTEGVDPDMFYDADGTEHEPWHRALVPVADPVPAYDRGRTFIEPNAAGDNR